MPAHSRSEPDDYELLDRAFQAWFRKCKREGLIPDQPSLDSRVYRRGTRRIVRLVNQTGTLAEYTWTGCKLMEKPDSVL